jgi:hypothetical protein
MSAPAASLNIFYVEPEVSEVLLNIARIASIESDGAADDFALFYVMVTTDVGQM